MADLSDVLPNFDLQPWKHLMFSLEKKGISTAELITTDPVEIAKRCPLPLKEVRRLTTAIVQGLQADISYPAKRSIVKGHEGDEEPPKKRAKTLDQESQPKKALFVTTLDQNIDECLGGGFAAGHISEIVGESAVGKTQFVLGLLLTAQLPPPLGLGRPVIYLSTESSLNTTRLVQMLKSHPVYHDLSIEDRPSLDRVLTISTKSIEAQEHIVQYQLPETVKRFHVGLVVMDSVAANYRAEFNGASRQVLTERSLSLAKLGNALRKIAHEHNVAIVVTNQVADRFEEARAAADRVRLLSSPPSSSAPSSQQLPKANQMGLQPSQVPPLPRSIQPHPTPSSAQARKDDILSLDYQQNFFTGWGDKPDNHEPQKTPSLGLTWTNQLNARVVLKMEHGSAHAASDTGNIWSDVKRRRYLSVVFASWAPPTIQPVQYSLEMQGPVSMPMNPGKTMQEDDLDENEEEERRDSQRSEHAELLDPKYWDLEDAEFP